MEILELIFYIFIALIGLSFLIFFHELGHFLAARAFGVKIERFSIGFGKVLWKKECCSTEWAISAIPLGGYVKMKGQDDLDPKLSSLDPDSYTTKKPWQRIIILFAGPLANIITAFFLYLFITIGGAPIITAKDYLPPIVKKVMPNSPAQKAGFKVGDKIISVNGRRIHFWYQISQEIEKSPSSLIFEVKRDKKILVLKLKSKEISDENEFQERIKRHIIGISTSVSPDEKIYFSFSEALFYAGRETLKALKLISTGVKKISTGEVSSENIGGPITIFDLMMKYAKAGFDYLLWMMALISINLGIINLLPIPALDGGHIMFNLYEIATRKKPNETVYYYLTLAGWSFMIFLMVYGMKNDITRIFHF
jgi:regulator of sigma E protease